MKTSTKQLFMGMALSVCSITASAQCPTLVAPNIIANTNNGNLTVSQTYSFSALPANVMSIYFLHGSTGPYWGNSSGVSGSYTFSNIPGGTYTVCVQDSISGCPTISSCVPVTITNTVVAPGCHASFNYHTDSNTCVTYFNNTSTGMALTYQWHIDGVSYNMANPSASLSNGSHYVNLVSYNSGSVCDSVGQHINVSCVGGTTVTPTPSVCHASFYTYRDSSCATHFVNTSTGSGLTYQWNIDGILHNVANPIVSLSNGSHYAGLTTLSGGSICDSTHQSIYVSCGSGATVTPVACHASFYTYRDSSCATHFVNTSTGSGLTYQWNIDGTFHNVANPVVSLSNGNHNIWLSTISGGSICDSTHQTINVSCGGGSTVTPVPTPCVANAQFSVFSDSLNAGNYFAYNSSTGTGSVSYLWNFGDGTTSTQQYPFHNYATPGQYIICLTLTATSGTTTCSSYRCDSSSVHRIAAGFFMSQLNVIPQAVTSVKEENTIKTLKAFPNPMLDELTLEIELTQATTKLAYTLIDAVGRVTMTNSISDSKTVINTSTLEKGFYFLTISNEQGRTIKTTKLVK